MNITIVNKKDTKQEQISRNNILEKLEVILKQDKYNFFSTKRLILDEAKINKIEENIQSLMSLNITAKKESEKLKTELIELKNKNKKRIDFLKDHLNGN